MNSRNYQVTLACRTHKTKSLVSCVLTTAVVGLFSIWSQKDSLAIPNFGAG